MSELIKEALCKKMDWAYSTWCGLPPIKWFIETFYKGHKIIEKFLEKYAPSLVEFWRSITLKRIIVVTCVKWVVFYHVVFCTIYTLFLLNPMWTRIFSPNSAVLALLHVTAIEDQIIVHFLPALEGRVPSNVSALKLAWERTVESKTIIVPILDYVIYSLVDLCCSIKSVITLKTLFSIADFICLMAPFWYFICVTFELVRYIHTFTFLKLYWNSIKLFLNSTKIGIFFRPYFVVRKESYFGEAINHFFKF